MKTRLNYQYQITIFLFISIIVFSTSSLIAQNENEELKLNIQIRPRTEFRNGLFTPILEGQKPAFFIGQRTRIGLNYSKNKKLQIGLSTQVVTTWGNDPQVQSTANDISLYEAWAQLHFNQAWSLKIGRQVLSYVDERILGKLDWNNAGRKHDAALLQYEKNKFKGNLVFAFNQNSEKVTNTFYDNSLSQPYKDMELFWMKYEFTKSISASVLAMNLGFQSPSDSSSSHLQTIGTNLYYKNNKVDISGTYYYQSGSSAVVNASKTKTNAWMAAAKAGYSFNKNVSFGIGSDYLSGRVMNAPASKNTFFNPLYGTGHKFYGFMDYFYVSSAHHNVGLWDSYLNLALNNAEKLSWQIALHHFESAAQVINYSGGKANAALGNEVDLTFNYKLMNEVKLSGGCSQMFTDPSMGFVKNVLPVQKMKSVQNWVWLSINFNPEILMYKSK
ncbi:MAG: alginate export family protein [Ginsengibacter sp.]